MEYYEPQHKRYKYTYEKYFNLQTIGDKIILTHLLTHEVKLRRVVPSLVSVWINIVVRNKTLDLSQPAKSESQITLVED